MDNFEQTKKSSLKNIEEGIDFSPKGFIDAPVLELVEFINLLPNYYTTSSCSGIISIYVDDNNLKGIKWILVKHRPIDKEEFHTSIEKYLADSSVRNDIVMLKCEAFLMHICCKDLDSAKILLQIAISNGLRESGIVIGNKRIILAIRSTSNLLESPIAKNGSLIVDDNYIDNIIHLCNNRIRQNFQRIFKFFEDLKHQFQWPIFQLELGKYNILRWGHSLSSQAINKEKYIFLTGGFGTENERKVSKRGQNAFIFDPLKDSLTEINEVLTSATHHSSCSFQMNDLDFLIISGGRKSPTCPLPCLQIFLVSDKSKSLKNDSEKIGFKIKWEENGDIPSPRWGHSLSSIGSNQFILIGGRDENQCFNGIYKLDVREMEVNQTKEIPEINFKCNWKKIQTVIERSSINSREGSFSKRFFHASTLINNRMKDKNDDHIYAYLVLIHGGVSEVSFTSSLSDCWIFDPNRDCLISVALLDENSDKISRFGHSITYIRFNEYILIGGQAFNSTNDSNESYQLNLQYDSQLIPYFKIKRLKININTPNETLSSVTSQPVQTLPCQECRSHHQTIFNNRQMYLHILGGGNQTLEFGPHYCTSLVLHVKFTPQNRNFEQILPDEKISFTRENSSSKNVSSSSSDLISKTTIKSEKIFVIYTTTNLAKKTKSYLESVSYFDKSSNITKVIDFDSIDCSTYKLFDADLNNESIDDISSLFQGKKSSIVAIPITETLFNLINKQELNSSLRTGLRDVLCSNIIVIGLSNRKESKRSLINVYKKADAFLNEICDELNFSSSAREKIPSKYEIIGEDVLMIPENCLVGPEWDPVLLDPQNRLYERVLGQLTLFFSCKRVARKALIDPGPLRESHIKILYPKFSKESTSSPHYKVVQDGPGWVKTIENKIIFGFDITKIMFCSGNITERMRMAKVNAQSQTIVDFYCGIGYYTIPLLLHAKASRVYAFEWNPNSIIALQSNLKYNHVEDRCTIFSGDNQQTFPEANIFNSADRILLGLLPSSVAGWPLAAKALNPNGGIIHVHENVSKVDISDWVLDCKNKFVSLFRIEGKFFDIEIEHIEKVKSYAPGVYHIVVDLICKKK